MNKRLGSYISVVYQTVTFMLLLWLYMTAKFTIWIFNLPFFPNFIPNKISPVLYRLYTALVKLFDHKKERTISRINLIELAIRNMQVKKTRTMVTIGGMVIGIGSIVFLVSIGYGLQQMVITRVARLEEMRQTDIAPQSGSKVKITDETLNNFKDIPSVEMSLPLIAVVGTVNYQSSVSDMVVYGVTTNYLKQSAIQPVQGRIFDSNELVTDVSNIVGQVAGVTSEEIFQSEGEKIQDIEFSIEPTTWLRVRKSTSSSAEILGYTKRVEGVSMGQEVWGGKYFSSTSVGTAGETIDGMSLGKWIKAPVLLWKKEACESSTQGDCEDGNYMVLRDTDNKQVQETGYFAEFNVSIKGSQSQQGLVLGETTDINGDPIDWVEIASESGVIQEEKIKKVALSLDAKREAVVSRSMLKVLGINENEAVGKKFTTSFVVVGELLADSSEKIESAGAEYTIVGVTPEEKTPIFYVPFMDLRSLGVTNYSQVKVVVKDQAELAKTRRQIEAMGYVTRSVADTVDQINSLFGTMRILLAILGMVALAVAALGMFNTLTVSLLERTREVGLMKALGMRSSEVRELFLTESMIMGFMGGILGIAVGFLAGKLVGLILSLFAVSQGVGFVDVSYVPFSFVVIIVVLSVLVGVVTGIYPARRATKISALNALRYE